MRHRTTAPAAGIVYAVLSVVGMLLLILEEIDSSTDEEILSYYGDSANRTAEIVGFVLVLVAALSFLVFLSSLSGQLRDAAPEANTLTTLGFGAGVAAAGLLAGGGALLSATSNAVEISNRFDVDPNLARFAVSTGFVFVVASVLFNCVFVATTSILALRTTVLPTWLGWVGLAAIVLAIVEAFLLPVFVIPVWVLIVSIVLLTSTRARPTSDT